MTPNLEQLAQETAEKCAKELMPPRSMWPTGQAPNDMLAAKMVAPYILRALEAAVEPWRAQVRMLEQNIVEQHNRSANELAQLRAREQRLRESLEKMVKWCPPIRDEMVNNAAFKQFKAIHAEARQALADIECEPTNERR
ncbi:MAG TPA: hypothetical protein VFU31_20940 [Candidatus Binatia bacterium]|nr:hypothetical protein [Candidatus Binatia bacterium]